MTQEDSQPQPVVTTPDPPKLSARDGAFWVAVILGIAGLTVLVAMRAVRPNTSSSEAAEVLAIVSLVAVGIERFIEGFWSLVSRVSSGWWPLNEIAAAVQSVVDDTNKAAAPAFAAAIEGLKELKKETGKTAEELAAIQKKIDAVQLQKDEYEKQIKRISSLAKDSQRVQLFTTVAFQAANRLDTAYGKAMPAVRQAFNDVSQVTTGASDILASFKDNPAKKMISIALGSTIGLLVAGFVGLDLFAAAGAPLGPTDDVERAKSIFPFLGVALTGLVLGLGANPTHEVVKYVSEVAKARQTRALPKVNISGSPDERDESSGETVVDSFTFTGARGTRSSHPRIQPGSMNLR